MDVREQEKDAAEPPQGDADGHRVEQPAEMEAWQDSKVCFVTVFPQFNRRGFKTGDAERATDLFQQLKQAQVEFASCNQKREAAESELAKMKVSKLFDLLWQ